MSRSLLVIDDDPVLSKNISTYLSRHGYLVNTASSGEEGLKEFESLRPDIVLLDFQLSGIDGLQVLRRVRHRDCNAKVIVVTGYGGVQVAVDAMKAGASDYLTKPLVLKELKLLLDKLIGQERMEGELAYYRNREADQSGLAKILGESPEMLETKRKVRQFLDAENQLQDECPPAVLITGETGTGKELVARSFHYDGKRKDKPFVEINCVSIPSHLLEAELFGFERGAFTDAKERKIGLVESAEGGTLFLDEIGEMGLEMQAKLLRLLEGKMVRRLGSVRDRKVNVRIIAATNQDLGEMVSRGEFRSDLYFRLRIIHIELPALRDRQGDIPLLADEFLQVQARRYGKEGLSFSEEAMEMTRQYPWPGNVREMRNVIEQAVLLVSGPQIKRRHLALSPELCPQPDEESAAVSLTIGSGDGENLGLDGIQVKIMEQALRRTTWNVTQAARLLGISRDTLRYRMEKYHLRAPS